MKRYLLVLLLFVVIINNGYSSEEKIIYEFFDNILDELHWTRELFMFYYNPGINNVEDLQIIEDEIKTHLSNVILIISDNRILIEKNISLLNIFMIVDYELNNIRNMNFNNNSYDKLGKIDMLLELIVCANIIYYYEPLIYNYNL
jgi:hypothetical protein